METKILTVYFSRSGNTKKVANLIHETVGGDIVEIKTHRTYSSSYAGAILQGGLEKFKNARPELFPLDKNPKDYDVIFVGTPIWWFTVTPAMKSFLETYDLSDKKVFLFLTNGGKPAEAECDFKTLCKGTVCDTLDIRFKGRTQDAPDDAIRTWAEKATKE